MYRVNVFCIRVPVKDGFILKNMRTGATVRLTSTMTIELDSWLACQKHPLPVVVSDLMGQYEFLVPSDYDELSMWQQDLLETRNHRAHIFTLHVEPTMQCQFRCGYCFERGIDRGEGMNTEVLKRSFVWLRKYFSENSEIDTFRIAFFGGEPLLRKDIVYEALEGYSGIAREVGINCWTEMTTNGELLDEDCARHLSRYTWRRVQITLDGPARIHDTRRCGEGNRPTFAGIMKNIKMLLETEFIPKIDLRLTLDSGTMKAMPELIDELASHGKQERINLSLGLTTSSLSVWVKRLSQVELADAGLEIWKYAQSRGFAIPDEFARGPLCIALAKHSAVLQPTGDLQKCFCTSGRPHYNFASIHSNPNGCTQDKKFEMFERTNPCVEERCSYLPICGGGCIHDALVAYGGESGFSKRFCEKELLRRMNEGLLRLNYT